MAQDRDRPDGVAAGRNGVDPLVLAAAIEAGPAPMALIDARLPGTPILWANAALASLTGRACENLRGSSWRLLLGPGPDPEMMRGFDEALAAGRAIVCALPRERKEGEPRRNGSGSAVYVFPVPAEPIGRHPAPPSEAELERRVGERTAAVEAELERKSALLQDIDHRIKNSLQTVTSLTLLKARRTPDGPARDALQTMAERVGALASAQRVLGASDDFRRFDLSTLAADILGDLAAGLDFSRITLTHEAEPIACPAAMAAPLALLLHELAANAVRHAFPVERRGSVRVAIRAEGEAMRITVADDGVGLDAGGTRPGGLGRDLVAMLARQLRGAVEYADAAPGTRVEITLPLTPGA